MWLFYNQLTMVIRVKNIQIIHPHRKGFSPWALILMENKLFPKSGSYFALTSFFCIRSRD